MSIVQLCLEDNLALIAMNRHNLAELASGKRTSRNRQDTSLESVARLQAGIAELEAANTDLRSILAHA